METAIAELTVKGRKDVEIIYFENCELLEKYELFQHCASKKCYFKFSVELEIAIQRNLLEEKNKDRCLEKKRWMLFSISMKFTFRQVTEEIFTVSTFI